MKKYFALLVLLTFLTSSIQAQQTRTPCKITVASGEVYEGYIKNYDVKTMDFNDPFKLLGKKGNKGREFNSYHIMLIEIKNKIYKPKVNSENERRLMIFLGENEDFSAYLDVATDERAMIWGAYAQQENRIWPPVKQSIPKTINYYFYKDEAFYKVPRKLYSGIFYHTMGPLFQIFKKGREKENEKFLIT